VGEDDNDTLRAFDKIFNITSPKNKEDQEPHKNPILAKPSENKIKISAI
jgi:hypothetical protein